MTRAKGWFVIPGVQAGDRTLAEQLAGLEPALALVAGKTVLDLGCAEGLLARTFAERGAAWVAGIDCNPESIALAQSLCRQGVPLSFQLGNLNGMLAAGALPESDVVLALAVLHKLRDPEAATRQAAALAREWLVVRLPGGSSGEFASKWNAEARCDTRAVLPACGLRLERDECGPNGERVHYWRREA